MEATPLETTEVIQHKHDAPPDIKQVRFPFFILGAGFKVMGTMRNLITCLNFWDFFTCSLLPSFNSMMISHFLSANQGPEGAQNQQEQGEVRVQARRQAPK